LVYSPSHCQECGKDMTQVEVISIERRQVFDLPPVKVEVVEHRSELKQCPGCQHLNRGEFPQSVNATVEYGERVRAISVYLQYLSNKPKGGISGILSYYQTRHLSGNHLEWDT